MEDDIHNAELEAYQAVLTAFSLRENAISWEKEILITDLRKELSISNDEHRLILEQTNANNLNKTIRKRHHTAVTRAATTNPSADMGSPVHVSRKRFKPENLNPSFADWNTSSLQPSVTHPPFVAASKQSLLPPCETEQVIPSEPQIGQPLIPSEAKGQKIVQILDGSGELSEVRDLEVGDDTIKIYDTNLLLQEVESLLACQNADPAKVAMARKLLQDQERALLAGINKLSALMAQDSPDPQQQHGE